MLKLKFNLRHQDIQLVNKGAVVATDSKNYLVAKFNTISDDWEAPLTAVFTDDKHKQPYAVIVGADERLAEDECFVPWEVLTDAANVYVSVYCGNLHTTITSAFKVRKSGYIEGETPPPPSPTVYDIIMQAITDLQVGKQDKLTAGENITINANGEISASGGVTSYSDLTDKPQINGVTLSGNKSATDLELKEIFFGTSNPPQDSYTEYPFHALWVNLDENTQFVLTAIDYSSSPLWFTWERLNNRIIQSTEPAPEYSENNVKYQYDNGDLWLQVDSGKITKISVCTGKGRQSLDYKTWRYFYYWAELTGGGAQIVSATVNKDGTITFTMSDGSTVTTTGESVIGPKGEQGDDYVLTAQDKTDIANIVLSELPTTQGVQYGNTSN